MSHESIRRPSPVVVTRPRVALAKILTRWLSLLAYGWFTRTWFGRSTAPWLLRRRFERFAAQSREAITRKYKDVRFEDQHAGPVPMESLRARESPRAVVLHLHGGAFVFGSIASYRNRALRLAHRFDAEVFVPAYRLAPEHVFPAALDDVVLAYQHVRRLRPDAPVFITGDSAGGGLALSLLLRLREQAETLPTGAVLLSPWTDLSISGTSTYAPSKDRWFDRAHLLHWARYYAAQTDLRTPLLSPVFADLSGLPPLLLLAGEDELLLDDAARVVAQVQRAGGDARLHVGQGMQHDWPLTLPWLDESREAWRSMRQFVDEHCARKSR